MMATLIKSNKKERVNKPVSKTTIARNEHQNKIYQADEATRRAIDALYVKKSSNLKAVLFAALVALFVGIGIGVPVGINMVHTSTATSTLKLELGDQLKAQAQPQN